MPLEGYLIQSRTLNGTFCVLNGFWPIFTVYGLLHGLDLRPSSMAQFLSAKMSYRQHNYRDRVASSLIGSYLALTWTQNFHPLSNIPSGTYTDLRYKTTSSVNEDHMTPTPLLQIKNYATMIITTCLAWKWVMNKSILDKSSSNIRSSEVPSTTVFRPSVRNVLKRTGMHLFQLKPNLKFLWDA